MKTPSLPRPRSASSRRLRHQLRAGFSLIEFMVVVVIISILVGVVAVNIMHAPDEAASTATKAQMKNFETALKMYRNKFNGYPSTAQGLNALIRKPAGVTGTYPAGGYLDSTTLPQDGWKQDFIYISPGKDGQPYEIISYGSDGEPGGEEAAADISSSDF